MLVFTLYLPDVETDHQELPGSTSQQHAFTAKRDFMCKKKNYAHLLFSVVQTDYSLGIVANFDPLFLLYSVLINKFIDTPTDPTQTA